ncbi:MAG: UDP-2,4-diacetamido-2,4,6-trideoxy-beta-L-altropyranose hydrolase [Alphaproteobacteria bacterium]|jgi:UDP-2,4-diacetamido-2,4,6-trideoxy-beta-L-altropyranose hydrolase
MVNETAGSVMYNSSNQLEYLSPLHFVFYANASSTIGAGHIMRLFGIAQVCIKHGIKVTFASCECPSYLQDRLHQAGFKYVSLSSSFSNVEITSLKANVFVIDDYNLQAQQWQCFVASGALLVNIDDDTHQQPLLSNIIINPAATAQEQAYKERAPQAVLCLGAKFTLLRQEFIQQAYTKIEQREQILITLGGADVKNMSYVLALSLLKRVSKSTQVQILLGGLHNSNSRAFHDLKQQYSNLHIIEQIHNVAAIMMQSGLAISAAGGTLGELARMGTPTIALVSVDNQKAALTSAHANTWYKVLDVREYEADQGHYGTLEHANLSTQLIKEITTQTYELWRDLCSRKRMSDQARQLIDGQGCQRVVEQILNAL